jgi:hypothetical protein
MTLDFSSLGGFDPRTVDPSQFTSIPLADYKCVIVGSEPKQNSAGTGGYLQLDVKIIEGQFAGSVVPDRLNLFHTDQTTVNIAKKRLSAYAHVVGMGVGPLQNSGQLHDRPFVATIGPQEKNPQYNEVKLVKDLQGNIPGKATANPVAQSQPTTQWPAAQNPNPVQQPLPPVQTQQQPNWGQPQTTFAPPVQQQQPVQQPTQQLPWQNQTQPQQPTQIVNPPWVKQ